MHNEKVWIMSDRNSKVLNHILIKNFFLQELQTDIKIYDKINTMSDLESFDFYQDDQIIYYAFENNQMSDYTKQKCLDLDIKYLDSYKVVSKFLSSIFSKISQGGDISEIVRKSIESNPVEFALSNDDGSNPQSIMESDVVILGVSRTSKTPLSLYMSNLGYKVTNIPLVPEIDLPKELFIIDSDKIVALLMDPERLKEIRKERIKSLGIPHDSGYASMDRILKELDYSKEVIEKLDCKYFDITHMSIEETSEKIKKAIDQRKGS